MDHVTSSWLLRPEPARDPDLQVDRLTRIDVDSEGTVTAATTSGVVVSGRLTRCGLGALRLRLARTSIELDVAAPSALLVGVDEQPASADDLAPWVDELTGMRLLGTLLGPGFGTGALNRAGAPGGWMLSLSLGADDAIYGGGECFQAVDLRGRVRRCVNAEAHGAAGLDTAYLTVPFFWTDSGRGLFVHTGAPVRADLGATHADVLAVAVDDPTLDVFLYAGDPVQMLAQHHHVTGRPGAVPDWALGVWTSRCSYFSAEEIDGIVDGYVAADCPVDVVHVDAWQVGNVIADLSTAWEVDRERFPVGWGKRLADRGVRLSLWHNPYLRAGTAAGDDAIARGFVLTDDDGGFVSTNDMSGRLLVDFTNPDARTWWHDHVVNLLSSEGGVSIKGDFAEEVPPTARCADGRTGWDVRNAYSVLYQQASYAALQQATGSDAAVMFNRSGTAGAQRYPGHWVGDTPSTWSGLASAVRACLSLSLSGFGFVGSDIGGFWTERRVDPDAPEAGSWEPSSYLADVDPELFVRWTQFGVLSPLMRFHGSGRREPWSYPAPYGDLAVAATRWRPRLAAYLAQAAAEAATVGTPVMRPMPLAFPGERAGRAAPHQWMLGPDLLVAPVLGAGGRVTVWAPPGQWRGLDGAPDLEGRDIQDSGFLDLELPLAALPAWVRDGATVTS
jgi:alpha-D-xyloside xylohydrolase